MNVTRYGRTFFQAILADRARYAASIRRSFEGHQAASDVDLRIAPAVQPVRFVPGSWFRQLAGARR